MRARWAKDRQEYQEKAARERAERDALRASALTKLTDDEIKALKYPEEW